MTSFCRRVVYKFMRLCLFYFHGRNLAFRKIAKLSSLGLYYLLCRSRRLRRITQTSALITLAIMRKTNPIIVFCLVNQVHLIVLVKLSTDFRSQLRGSTRGHGGREVVFSGCHAGGNWLVLWVYPGWNGLHVN